MKPIVLIADPFGTLSTIVVTCVSHRGYEIETAIDGIECLAKLRSMTPDVLILQAGLLWGGVEGILAEIREDQCIPYIPTVVIDGNYSHGREIELLTSPVVRWLRKPLKPALVRAAIERAFAVAHDMHEHSLRTAKSLAQ
jgi:DNA-binding NtrC family response regulator